MATRRQGRFRGEPEPKPIKVIPLRYRILPVERDFDIIDSLQTELNREYNAGKMDADMYFTMRDVLDRRRATLTSRRAALTGESIERDYDAMPYSVDAKSFSFKVTPFVAGCLLVAFVVIGLAISGK